MSNLNFNSPADPIPSITLQNSEHPEQEGQWLEERLHRWLDEQFIPEAVNGEISHRAAQIFIRQRMEGENDLITLVLALIMELENYDFSQSFFGNFAVANAVGELVLDSLGINQQCCGQ